MCDCTGRGTCMWNQTIKTNNTDFKRVECLCRRGVYSGDKCQNVIDYCTNNPCTFNRSCSSLNESELITLIEATNGSSNLNISKPFKGYVCGDCPNGSKKDSMDRCIDVDECLNSSTPVCNTTRENCNNLEFSYECICKAGFSRSSQTSPCEDIDECRLGTSNCDQICTNTEGSFICSCFEGYIMQPNNLCLKNSNCSVPPDCDYCTANSTCLCKPGYSASQNKCVDIDECSPQTSLTSPCNQTSSTCMNKNGSYSCDCKVGYYRKEGFEFCQPCEAGFFGINCMEKCNCLLQKCSYINGCTSCDSKGWKIPFCTEDIDECAINSTTCGNGNCTNTNGSYICTCEPWFTFSSGVRCEILDACFTDSANNLRSGPPCQNGGSCTNGTNLSKPGSFDCTCLAGYNGTLCEEDINDCIPNPCYHGGTCVDKVNGYDCQCPIGYSGPLCEYAPTVEEMTTATTANSTGSTFTYTGTTTASPSSSKMTVTAVQTTTASNPTQADISTKSTTAIIQSSSAETQFASSKTSSLPSANPATTSPMNVTAELAPAVITAIIFPIVFSSLTCASFSIIFGLNFLKGFFPSKLF